VEAVATKTKVFALQKPIVVRQEPYTQEPFHVALDFLMKRRKLSYRMMAYKTGLSAGYINHLSKGSRPAPSDQNIVVIARALHVEPDFFAEYRLRFVMRILENSPAYSLLLYDKLKRRNGHA